MRFVSRGETGRGQRVLTVEDLLARLCTPSDKSPPRFHLTRYAGVLASNAALQAEVVPGHANGDERNNVTNELAGTEGIRG